MLPQPEQALQSPAEPNAHVDNHEPSARGTPSRLMTARQVAELLGVPQSWIYEQSRAGRIPTVTLGRYRRYRREAIEAWLIELERAAGGPGRVAR
jgi:excisionase family DNA binding protein